MFFKDGSTMLIQANEKPLITGMIHKVAVPKEMVQIPTHLLADNPPIEAEDYEIQLLIGLDYMQDIIGPDRNQIAPGFYATESKLGLILGGRVGKLNGETGSSILAVNVTHREMPLNEKLESKALFEDLGSLDRIGIHDDEQTNDDEQAMKNFEETVEFCEGRYAVIWPWKQEMKPDTGPSNYGLAMGRLKSTMNRLSKDPGTFDKYNGIIQEQFEKDIIEVAPPADTLSHYLPHHPVITPGKATTKVRIVYDASAKPRKGKTSLNDCLYRGPVMLKDLAGLLLRFRMHSVVLLSDIEKAFLQIELKPSERNFCRFLWLKNPKNMLNSPNNIQHFQFRRVPFGVISSPFLLAATVSHHLKLVGTQVAMDILDNIYVDNVTTGSKTMADAIEFYKEAKQIFADASMNLREWCSNSEEFLNMIPEKDRAKGGNQKVLGIKWNTETDNLSISTQKADQSSTKPTKRHVLQMIASIFDPLGLVSFGTFKAKVFLQKLWLEEMGWDQPLSDSLSQEWNEIKNCLGQIGEITIPRFVNLCKENSEPLLICFTDASEKGYAALVYLKFNDQVNLIFAKARVAPKASKKLLTIPRLELMGVWIGSKILRFVEEQLKRKFEKKILWCDSQCVLHWLKSKEICQVFVANRVRDIKHISGSDIDFRYISTKENPADIATRGLSVTAAENSIWWHGPQWLTNDVNKWPTGELPSVTEKVQEQVKSEIKTVEAQENVLVSNSDLKAEEYKCVIQRFSNVSKLIRVIAWCLRLKNGKHGLFSIEELNVARSRLLGWSQAVNFQDTMIAIRKKKLDKVSKNFGLKQHEDGLLHCHSRFENSRLNSSAMYPILLAKYDPLTDLMIAETHVNLFHAGTEHTLAHLRYSYWIPQGRRQVQRVIRQCKICKKNEGGPYPAPKMSAWPQKRVTQSIPFSYTGLDYCGPLYIREGKSSKKVWICLFTCLASRAIYLDVVENMSTEAFLRCLSRFISVRGCPIEITCDNATTFKLAKNVMEQLWKRTIYDPTTINYCSERGIHWNYIVELAPWMGGVYERLIGLVKRALRKALGKNSLSFVQLQTLLFQISAILNSRPLTYVGDFSSGHPLAPVDLLNPGVRLGIPAPGVTKTDPDYSPKKSLKEELCKNWQERMSVLDEFWKQWESEYLLSLRERNQLELKQSRIRAKGKPQLNDVVLVKENQLPRGREIGKGD